MTLTEPVAEEAPPAAARRRARWPPAFYAEALMVAASPIVAYLVLRIRVMAPVNLPDPSMHTMFLLDPHDIFERFSKLYQPYFFMREGARAGFLVPGRIVDLLFGAVPGFLVFRYVLALVAVVPAYVLLRRLYGPLAGAAAIVVVLSNPVVLTAWGTDYPDSAVVSYALAGLACLAMPSPPRRRRAWLAAAAAFFTLATWAHGMGGLLAVTAFVCWLALRLLRERKHLPGDLALVLAVGVGVTGVLVLASGPLLGQYDFIIPTWDGAKFLMQPGREAANHAVNRHWAASVPFILVPPAVLAAYAAAFAGRLRKIETPQLVVGTAFAAQVAVYWLLEFFGKVETLEAYIFGSTLWASVCLGFAVLVGHLCRRWRDRPLLRFAPLAAVAVVPVVYAWHRVAPSLGGTARAAWVAALLVVAVALARLAGRLWPGAGGAGGAAAGALVATGCALLLTVAPLPGAPADAASVPTYLPGIDVRTGGAGDFVPAYAGALGGDAAPLVDAYRVTSEIPAFVGNATRPDELLVMWAPFDYFGPLLEPWGLYRAGFNSLPVGPPDLTKGDQLTLAQRRPAELLLLDTDSSTFPAAVQALAPYQPTVVRSTVLRSGSYTVALELLTLQVYAPAP